MTFEIRPEDAEPQDPDAHQLVWGSPDSTEGTLYASVDAWLSEIGPVADPAIDLVRLATAAYVADRQTPRRSGYSRSINLHVRVTDPERWAGASDLASDLLYWLSSDEWSLTFSADGLALPGARVRLEEPFQKIALLSGGLDSFAGALIDPDTRTRYIGHWDNPTTKASQDRAWAWLSQEAGIAGEFVQLRLAEKARKREASTRTRALLFMALGVAAATEAGLATVEIPENGFTSINIAMGNNRGGALSTRSTHPWTIRLFEELLAEIGIELKVHSPHLERTKGELLKLADKSVPLKEGAPRTLSCAKLDGARYKGGNPNHHCGLCVACLVRRGAFATAGVNDGTTYLCNTLKGTALNRLRSRRGDDVAAVRHAITQPIDEFSLLAQGPYPDNLDLEMAADVCRRGFAELRKVIES